jgi:HEAT repeat protein
LPFNDPSKNFRILHERPILVSSPDEYEQLARRIYDETRRLPRKLPVEKVRAMRRLMQGHPDLHVRHAAAHWLSFSFDGRALASLLVTVENAAEDPFVRGQAIEGFGVQLHRMQRRRRIVRRAERALRRALDDPSPEVRFWACYSLGAMGAARALGKLQFLARHDDALYPTWWLVKEEAADAVLNVRHQPHPERERIANAPE